MEGESHSRGHEVRLPKTDWSEGSEDSGTNEITIYDPISPDGRWEKRLDQCQSLRDSSLIEGSGY